MHIIAGIGLVVVLLFAWIAGNLLARLAMFVVLSLIFGFYGWLWIAYGIQPHDEGRGVLGALFGIGFAWPIANLPVYLHKRNRPRHFTVLE